MTPPQAWRIWARLPGVNFIRDDPALTLRQYYNIKKEAHDLLADKGLSGCDQSLARHYEASVRWLSHKSFHQSHKPKSSLSSTGASTRHSYSESSAKAPSARAMGRRSPMDRPLDPSGPSLMAVVGAMSGLFRGVGSTGLGNVTFGLQALGRRHEEQRLEDHPAGVVVPPGPPSAAEAARLLDSLELAHAAYRKSAAGLAATSCLRLQHIREWRPENGRLQPGYFVAVDHPGRRVVWGVRGTQIFSDVLTDLAMASHPLGVGEAHWGMTHAAHWMLQQEASNVGALLRSLRPSGAYRLELVGHSLGGAVAALAAVMLREGLVEAARTSGIPPGSVSCMAFAPPAVMSVPLAGLCRPYVTSVVLNNDIVSRFNAASLAVLQLELQEVDWYGELQRTLADHALVKSLSSTLGSLVPAPFAPRSTDGPSSSTATAAPPPAPAATAAMQQLSAAVLDSPAFKAAVDALDEWKAKAVAATGDQSEVAIRRQADLFRTWLQDMASINPALRVGTDKTAAEDGGGACTDGTANSPAWLPAATNMDEVRRAAEAASERLRLNAEAAVASLTAAAVTSRDKLSASLPSLPSLPHELPLIEQPAAAGATAAAAAGAAGTTAGTQAGDDTATVLGAAAAAAGAAAGKADGSPMVLPMLLPPGRILYIRPRNSPGAEATATVDTSASANKFKTGPAASNTATAAAAAGSATTASASAFAARHCIVELPEGTAFNRMVLRRSALTEHQCRSYRRVLAQLALQT